jgi:hypothetical protein
VTGALNRGRACPPTTGSATRLADGVNGFRSAPRSSAARRSRLLSDRDLGEGAALLHRRARLDDRGLASDEVLLADGELLLYPATLRVLDPIGGVVDRVHNGVGEAAVSVLETEDELGGADLQVDVCRAFAPGVALGRGPHQLPARLC